MFCTYEDIIVLFPDFVSAIDANSSFVNLVEI